MKEMVGGCCVCSDERGWDENPLVYCDGQSCNVAVHQACYGIVSVPSGPWFCRKCESQERTARVHCELCPSRDGALKKTDTNGWAHVVCALYIPEVRFGNVTTMEPIQISLIPQERFNKTCYICEESNKESKASFGACMTCNKPGCKQSFHVTCAQLLGLLCEEAGNLMDNVKYCGYCRLHYSKLKKTSNMKIIPPYKPVGAHLSESPASSPDKSQKGPPSLNNTPEDMQMSISSSSSSTNSINSSGGKKLGTSSSHSTLTNGKLNPGSNSLANTSQQSPLPRVPHQPSNLFSSGAFAASLSSSKSEDLSNRIEKGKLKMLGGSKAEEDSGSKGNSNGDRESWEGNRNFSKSDTYGKPSNTNCTPYSHSVKNKDFSNISATDVVAAVLDRPISSATISSSASKFDIPTTTTTTTTATTPEASNTNSNPSSGSSTSSSRVDKPPPDIKPHVTLTPIPPIRLSTGSIDDGRTTKSPAHHFPHSFGQKNHRQVSPDIDRDLNSKTDKDLGSSENCVSATKRSRVAGDFDSDTDSASETWPERQIEDEEINQNRMHQHMSRKDRYILMGNEQDKQNHNGPMGTIGQNHVQDGRRWDRSSKSPTVSLERMRFTERDKSPMKMFGTEFSSKRGPGRPVKRHSGNSRDEDRKPSLKVRGRRGGSSNGSFSRRDMTNGNTPPSHENSFDDTRESGSSQSLSMRGGRHSAPLRKSAPTTGPKKPIYDEVTPTLSQIVAQKAANSSDKASTLAPQMFGNVLNTNSSMANRLVDTLSQEMEAATVAERTSPQAKLVGVPFPGKSPTTNGTVTVTNGPSSSSRSSAAPPQTLEELLERQWEQGSQFLMEQAEHLDIAQLLSCLNQLKQDNRALEDHVASLIQRKEHLSAINARLQIPLSSSGTLGASFSGSSGQGTPPMPPASNKGLTGRGPSPQQQLQQQIQQEMLLQQGRIPTHPFPGTETNSHVQPANQLHNHGQMNSHVTRRELTHSNSGSGQQMYNYNSGGLPTPVVTSHQPCQQPPHHPSIPRD